MKAKDQWGRHLKKSQYYNKPMPKRYPKWAVKQYRRSLYCDCPEQNCRAYVSGEADSLENIWRDGWRHRQTDLPRPLRAIVQYEKYFTSFTRSINGDDCRVGDHLTDFRQREGWVWRKIIKALGRKYPQGYTRCEAFSYILNVWWPRNKAIIRQDMALDLVVVKIGRLAIRPNYQHFVWSNRGIQPSISHKPYHK